MTKLERDFMFSLTNFCFFSSVVRLYRGCEKITLWNLSLEFQKLYAWIKDLNPKLQQYSSSQAWVKCYGLA